MKIASKIKPRSGVPRRVTVHDRLYVFGPVKDRNEETHYVAEVKNALHAETFMASGDFYHYSAEFEPVPLLNRPPVVEPETPPPAPAPPVVLSGDQTGTITAPPSAPLPWNPEVIAEATELLKGTAGDISTAVGRVSHPDVVKAAQDLESKSDKPRKNVQQLLEITLAGIQASGQSQT